MKRLLILSLALCFTLTSCGMITEEKAEEAADECIEFMEDNYDDEFSLYDMYYYPKEPDKYEFLLDSEKFPDVNVTVGYQDGVYRDNYIGFYYEEQTKEYIYDVLEGCFGKGNVYVDYTAPYDHFYESPTDDVDFDEYISEMYGKSYMAVVSMDCEEIDQEEVEDILQQAFYDAEICCFAKIHFYTDGFDISEMNDENYYDDYLFFKNYTADLYFTMNEDFDMEDVDWEVIEHEEESSSYIDFDDYDWGWNTD